MNGQRKWPGTTPDMQTKFMLLFFDHKCAIFFDLQEWVPTGDKKEKEKNKKKEQRVPLREIER